MSAQSRLEPQIQASKYNAFAIVHKTVGLDILCSLTRGIKELRTQLFSYDMSIIFSVIIYLAVCYF